MTVGEAVAVGVLVGVSVGADVALAAAVAVTVGGCGVTVAAGVALTAAAGAAVDSSCASLALHAAASGRRMVYLGRFADTRDLLDDAISWNRKDAFPLQVRQGETRLFLIDEGGADQP